MLWWGAAAAPVSDLEDLTQLLLNIQTQKAADKIQDLQDLLDVAAAQNWPTILKAIHEFGNPTITQNDNYDDDTVEVQGWKAVKNLLQVISALNNAQDNNDAAGQSWINTNALTVLKAIHALNIPSIIEDNTTDLQSRKVVRKHLLGIPQFPSNNVAVQDSRKMNARNILKALHALNTIDSDDDTSELHSWKVVRKHLLGIPQLPINDVAVQDSRKMNAHNILKALHALKTIDSDDDTSELQSWKVVRKYLLGIPQLPINDVAVQDSRKMNAHNILKALHALKTIDSDDDAPELQGWKGLMKNLPHILQFPNAQKNDIAVLEVMNPKKDPMYKQT